MHSALRVSVQLAGVQLAIQARNVADGQSATLYTYPRKMKNERMAAIKLIFGKLVSCWCSLSGGGALRGLLCLSCAPKCFLRENGCLSGVAVLGRFMVTSAFHG